MPELADGPDLGSGVARRGGSSPPFPTNKREDPTKYCDFIDRKGMELILGGNIARILKIWTDVRRTPRPKLVDIV